MFNFGPTFSTLARHCINVIQMFCVCWDVHRGLSRSAINIFFECDSRVQNFMGGAACGARWLLLLQSLIRIKLLTLTKHVELLNPPPVPSITQCLHYWSSVNNHTMSPNTTLVDESPVLSQESQNRLLYASKSPTVSNLQVCFQVATHYRHNKGAWKFQWTIECRRYAGYVHTSCVIILHFMSYTHISIKPK